MAVKDTFDEVWENLKTEDESSKKVFEAAELTADVINSIVRARIKKGWSQRDLARECGMKQAAIARIEKLQVIPRLDTVARLAACVGVRLAAETEVEETIEKNSEPVVITFTLDQRACDSRAPYRIKPRLPVAAIV